MSPLRPPRLMYPFPSPAWHYRERYCQFCVERRRRKRLESDGRLWSRTKNEDTVARILALRGESRRQLRLFVCKTPLVERPSVSPGIVIAAVRSLPRTSEASNVARPVEFFHVAQSPRDNFRTSRAAAAAIVSRRRTRPRGGRRTTLRTDSEKQRS